MIQKHLRRKRPSEKRLAALHEFHRALDQADEQAGEGSLEIVQDRHGGGIRVNGARTVRFGTNIKLV